MKLRIGYPNKVEEIQILKSRMERKSDDVSVPQVLTAQDIFDMQNSTENVHVDDSILGYITDVVRETRSHAQIEVGASPRGSLALLRLAQTNAFFCARDYVTPDDVKYIMVEALSHRIIPKATSWIRGFDSEQVIKDISYKVPVPRVD
jgi:MoxR-like ATPase